MSGIKAKAMWIICIFNKYCKLKTVFSSWCSLQKEGIIAFVFCKTSLLLWLTYVHIWTLENEVLPYKSKKKTHVII